MNALFLGGLALVCLGVWLMWRPAGVVASGLALVVVALGLSATGGPPAKREGR